MKSESPNFNKIDMMNQLVKSKHGDLINYVNIVNEMAKSDIEYLSHLMTWNLIKGEIRDSKVAIPILVLRNLNKDDKELAENAVANLLSLDPTNLMKAFNFNKQLYSTGSKITGNFRSLFELGLKKYLEVRQDNPGWWIPTAVQHRKSLKALYAVSHMQPNDLAQSVLFDQKYPSGSVFEKIKQLKNMSPEEAAGTILQFNIPTQIALPALGKSKKELSDHPEFILSLLEKMSGQQLLNNSSLLTKLGVFDSPILKSEYNKAIERAKKDKKVSTLKAGKAIQNLKEKGIIDEDHDIIKKLEELQEVKISQKGIDGDWLVLGDASGSMHVSIQLAIEISSYITKSVKGKVYLIFFDTDPKFLDVTGMTLEEIKVKTKYMKAGGATSCGCGIQYLMEKNIIVNGIALVSDGGDNRYPLFHDAYKRYSSKFSIEPSVYFFRVPGDYNVVTKFCNANNVHINQQYEFNGEQDYYSIPNIIPSMKTSRWSLMDEIMNTPLLTLDKVLKIQRKEK